MSKSLCVRTLNTILGWFGFEIRPREVSRLAVESYSFSMADLQEEALVDVEFEQWVMSHYTDVETWKILDKQDISWSLRPIWRSDAWDRSDKDCRIKPGSQPIGVCLHRYVGQYRGEKMSRSEYIKAHGIDPLRVLQDRYRLMVAKRDARKVAQELVRESNPDWKCMTITF